MNMRWLVRASKWARNPPSAGRVKFVFAIIALCLALYAYEYVFGWPDSLTPDASGRRGFKF